MSQIPVLTTFIKVWPLYYSQHSQSMAMATNPKFINPYLIESIQPTKDLPDRKTFVIQTKSENITVVSRELEIIFNEPESE